MPEEAAGALMLKHLTIRKSQKIAKRNRICAVKPGHVQTLRTNLWGNPLCRSAERKADSILSRNGFR